MIFFGSQAAHYSGSEEQRGQFFVYKQFIRNVAPYKQEATFLWRFLANPAKNVNIQRMYVLLQESLTTYDFLIGFFLTINDTSVLTRFDKDLK